jgi:photosystem II stability/assembly factor-like uncharacterized protein
MIWHVAIGGVSGVAAVIALWMLIVASASMRLSTLLSSTHVHDIALAGDDRQVLYLATHDGLYIARANGTAVRVTAASMHIDALAAAPGDSTNLIAGGHSGKRTLGIVRSTDGGISWTVSMPPGSPLVDVHALAVDPLEPVILIGSDGVIARSGDRGKRWTAIGPSPPGANAFAISRNDGETFYAATDSGLLSSHDGGHTWFPLRTPPSRATIVRVTREGKIYAFTSDAGFIWSKSESRLSWQSSVDTLKDMNLSALAVDPARSSHLIALGSDKNTGRTRLLETVDGGGTWHTFGPSSS